jgi:hypothetical protein
LRLTPAVRPPVEKCKCVGTPSRFLNLASNPEKHFKVTFCFSIVKVKITFH